MATSLANALVSSRLDYCNSLFFAVSEGQLKKLQLVQNCLARVVTQSSKFACASTLLAKLHWSPIQSRIAFKINLLTYKALNYKQPVYLSDLLKYRHYPKDLRVNQTKKLKPIHNPKKGYGSNSFACSAPALWNPLPKNLHNASSINVFKTSQNPLFQ